MNKQKVLNLFSHAGGTKLLRMLKKNKLTVLSLHRISPERDYFFNPITPNHFELLLKYVSKHYAVISFSDIVELQQAKQKSGKPYLILSFDDGYYDFIEYALPLLVKYNLPGNHNIVNSCANSNELIWTQRLNTVFNYSREHKINITFNIQEETPYNLSRYNGDWMSLYIAVFKSLLNIPRQQRMECILQKENELSVSSHYRMMNWDEIIECSKHRVEIGSHTYNHDVLSTIKDFETLQYEILQSKIEIEEKISKPVHILALPNGQTNTYITHICRVAGISQLLYVEDKINNWGDFDLNTVNPFYRIGMVDESPPEMFLRAELFHSTIRKYV